MKGLKLLGFAIGLGLLAVTLLLPGISYAHCPLCVAGAGAGLTLSRLIGLDDSISGVWLAALLGGMVLWSYSWLVRKIGKGSLPILKPLVYLLVFTSTILMFYQFNLVITMEKIYGLHKLTFGIVTGGILFYLVDLINDLIIKIRGKHLFPYQRLATGLGSMIILSYIIYILIGYYI